MAETKSFYDIISNYIIEVPIIQREYAQGRNTEKVKYIRQRFVDDLIRHIKSKETMHLGFIYGKIEGKDDTKKQQMNKEAVTSILEAVKAYATNLELKISAEISDDSVNSNSQQASLRFIPLDGQQRLTTLFLLYWYLNLRNEDSDVRTWIYNFKYNNRKSSLAFCWELANEDNIAKLRKKITDNPNINLSKYIKGSAFYLSKWNKDTTVSGMIEMLDTIHETFKNGGEFDFTGIKVKEIPFQMDFLDIDELRQTDELYVKMNSRGKQLSDFEHFKAWLQDQYKTTPEEDKEWLKRFWQKLDTDWLNYFWRNIDADFSALDDFYYNFIKNIALIRFVATEKNVSFDNIRDLYSLIRNTEQFDTQKISYIPLDKYRIKNDQKEEIAFLFNTDILKFIEKVFDMLLLYEDEEKFAELELTEIIREPFVESNLFDFFTKSKMFTPTLWHSVYYYAFLVFITDETINIKEHKPKLKAWMRLTRNLIYNTYIQNPDNFNNALKQIELMSQYKMDIYASVTNGLFANSFFESSQFEEEKIKISLLRDENWKREIGKTENHEYFYGQIKFILNFSQKENVYDFELFRQYSKCISQLYGSDIRTSREKLLQRALLSIGDYLPARSANYIFCSSTAGGLRTINENWRLYFKGDKNKRAYLKTLVDALNTNEITKDVLRNYLDTYIKTNLSDNSEWKSLFIKYPKAILFCNESAIRRFSESNIRLLKGSMIVAYHAELRTYCFFLKYKANDGNAPEIFSPFNVFEYFEDRGTDGHPGCYLSGFVFDNKEYRIDIRYSFDKNADEFEICFYHSTDSIEKRNADERITFLLSEYQFDEKYKHYRKFVKYADLDNELVEVCTKLKTS